MLRKVCNITFGFCLLALTSCGSKKDGVVKLEKVKDHVLIDFLDSLSSQEFNSFYTKISTEYTDSSRTNSFKTSVRLFDDSLMNALITYARIPIVNALVSPDSLIVSNKRDKCYIKQSLGYIRNSLGLSFSFQNMEELFLGQPLGFDIDSNYIQLDETEHYRISTHKKREAKKAEKNARDEIITTYFISPDLKLLDRVQLDSFGDSTTVVIDYLSWQEVSGRKVPNDVNLTIFTPRQEIKIKLEYSKVRIDAEETIHFVIPEEYEECQ